VLYSLSIVTGAASYITTINTPNIITQMAFNSKADLFAWDDTLKQVVHVNYTSGVSTPLGDPQSIVHAGLTFTHADELLIMTNDHVNSVSTSDGAQTVGVAMDLTLYGINGDIDLSVAMSCGPDSLCYVLWGDNTISTLVTLDIATGAFTLFVDDNAIDNTGIKTLQSLAVTETSLYMNAPQSATQGIERVFTIYASPSFYVPVVWTLESSTNPSVLAISSIVTTTVDDSTQSLTFTSNTQGFTTLSITAVDSSGRTYKRSFAVEVLAVPRLTQPPSKWLSLSTSTTNTVPIRELNGLDGTSFAVSVNSATNTTWLYDLRIDSTSISWSSAANAGTASLTATANNVYGGTASVSFDVVVQSPSLCL
jgi:hypothetical protein